MLFWEVGRAWEEMNLDNSVENILLFYTDQCYKLYGKITEQEQEQKRTQGLSLGRFGVG